MKMFDFIATMTLSLLAVRNVLDILSMHFSLQLFSRLVHGRRPCFSCPADSMKSSNKSQAVMLLVGIKFRISTQLWSPQNDILTLVKLLSVTIIVCCHSQMYSVTKWNCDRVSTSFYFAHQGWKFVL